MPATSSRFSFGDCYEVFDRALASERGLAVRFVNEGAARQFVMRMHKARAMHREDNAETYPPDHPLHGRSEYDPFILRIQPNSNGYLVKIEKLDYTHQIEEL